MIIVLRRAVLKPSQFSFLLLTNGPESLTLVSEESSVILHQDSCLVNH